MKRAIILVIDSLGVGALPDAEKYGDPLSCNTLVSVARYNKGLNLPNLQKMGLGNIDNIEGVEPNKNSIASYGVMEELSEGKDTTTGHLEIAGLVLEEPFRTYPQGFPQFIIDEFVKRTGCKSVLANIPASGTAIIEKLGDEHRKTGYPIVYTSADSVFQIACHIQTTPLEKLYEWCEIARKLLDENSREHNVCRVIARPFEGESGNYSRISAARRDYSVVPPEPTILNKIVGQGGKVLGIGKIEDIFVKSGITHAIHTGSNREGLELTIKALQGELKEGVSVYKEPENSSFELIFNNLVDTDMLFGHRNDPVGYGKALEEIDEYLGKILPLITNDDLLIITADHGCDPTAPGTDHTRERVPIILYNPKLEAKNLGTRKTFADVSATVADWFGVEFKSVGVSMI